MSWLANLFGAYGKWINPKEDLKYWKSPCHSIEPQHWGRGALNLYCLPTAAAHQTPCCPPLQKWWEEAELLCSPGARTFGTLTPAPHTLAPARSARWSPSQSTDSAPGKGLQGDEAQHCFPSLSTRLPRCFVGRRIAPARARQKGILPLHVWKLNFTCIVEKPWVRSGCALNSHV